MKINYLQFKKLQEQIKDNEDNELFVKHKIAEIFFKGVNTDKNIEKFNKALLNKKLKLNFNLDFNFKTADRFIDCDTYFSRNQTTELFLLVVKPKYFWQSTKQIVNHLTVQEAEYIINLFIYARKLLKSDINGYMSHL